MECYFTVSFWCTFLHCSIDEFIHLLQVHLWDRNRYRSAFISNIHVRMHTQLKQGNNSNKVEDLLVLRMFNHMCSRMGFPLYPPMENFTSCNLYPRSICLVVTNKGRKVKLALFMGTQTHRISRLTLELYD